MALRSEVVRQVVLVVVDQPRHPLPVRGGGHARDVNETPGAPTSRRSAIAQRTVRGSCWPQPVDPERTRPGIDPCVTRGEENWRRRRCGTPTLRRSRTAVATLYPASSRTCMARGTEDPTSCRIVGDVLDEDGRGQEHLGGTCDPKIEVVARVVMPRVVVQVRVSLARRSCKQDVDVPESGLGAVPPCPSGANRQCRRRVGQRPPPARALPESSGCRSLQHRSAARLPVRFVCRVRPSLRPRLSPRTDRPRPRTSLQS